MHKLPAKLDLPSFHPSIPTDPREQPPLYAQEICVQLPFQSVHRISMMSRINDVHIVEDTVLLATWELPHDWQHLSGNWA